MATGRAHIPFTINATLLVVALPTIVWLAKQYGAMGGAASWALLGLVYLFVGTTVTGRRVASFAGGSWLVRDIMVPLTIALVPALLGVWLTRMADPTPLFEIMIATLAACVGIAAGVLYSPFARQQMLALVRLRTPPCSN